MLQHGLMDDGFTWLVPSWENTIVKLLTDHDFECWLLSSRGTMYSFEHETLTTGDKAYWAFSFEEMGDYDQPAYVEYIKKLTGVAQIHAYIGHSQGTTQMFTKLSKDPSFGDNFKHFVALSPVTYVANNAGKKSPLIELMSKVHLETILEGLNLPAFLYVSNAQVVPIFGEFANTVPGVIISEFQNLVSGSGSQS